jgi:hypothetical protein
MTGHLPACTARKPDSSSYGVALRSVRRRKNAKSLDSKCSRAIACCSSITTQHCAASDPAHRSSAFFRFACGRALGREHAHGSAAGVHRGADTHREAVPLKTSHATRRIAPTPGFSSRAVPLRELRVGRGVALNLRHRADRRARAAGEARIVF